MIKAKERPLESTSPLEKNGVAQPMKNVTVGECKTGKKKNKVQKRWRMQVWKKKTKFKSPGKFTVGILKKSDD